MSKKAIFRLTFINQGQSYEVYARQIQQSHLWGFLEVEELMFGNKTQVVVDPGEEKLKAEFEGVKRTYIPIHAVVRIDEVDHQGTPKIKELSGDKVTPFPIMVPGNKLDG